MIRGIETVVVRVSDYSSAADWYCTILGCTVVFTDPVQGLVVLHFGHGTTLTLWQFRPGESLQDDPQPCPFPVVATTDAVAQRIDLAGRGVRTSGLSEFPAFRFFSFWDPDGNQIGASERRGPVTKPRWGEH